MVEQGTERVLDATGIVAGYGGKEVLSGVDVHVARSEIVAIIGHNGAGKTTLLKVLFGLLRKSAGAIALEGGEWKPNPASLISMGMTYVPQGNRVFPALTVRENLRIALISANRRDSVDEGVERVMTMFPVLAARLNQVAGTLSGGERQMLALGRALICEPRLLLLDEPSLGLAPPLVSKALDMVRDLASIRSMSIIVVEQKVREVLRIATRVYVLRQVRVAFQGSASLLAGDEEVLRNSYL